VVEAVHEKLRGVAAALSGGLLPLSSFVITKQLTKRPEDYPDAKGQPHVQVMEGDFECSSHDSCFCSTCLS
jgi:DNA polymerase alpha subunit A